MKRIRLLIARIFGIDKMIYRDILEELSRDSWIRTTYGWTGNQPKEFHDAYRNILVRYTKGHFNNYKSKHEPVYSSSDMYDHERFIVAWYECGGPAAWKLKRPFSWYDRDKAEWTYANDFSKLWDYEPHIKEMKSKKEKKDGNG
jgi:hypothetical protein